VFAGDKISVPDMRKVVLKDQILSIVNQPYRHELLLFWANRDSYGLPVGSNASRILAEASLIDVDSCRYAWAERAKTCG
jgi:hypothetical protein